MKWLLTFIRTVVGVLFIFSGLIKANDPLGLSYKMQEFFELWHFTQFNGATLLISVVLISLEIVVGCALLLGWKTKFVSWLLLVLIVFFTFLTGYAFLSGKFKNCGCFGDCLPISPLTSFIKDLVLLVLILFLFRFKQKILPVFSNKVNTLLMLVLTSGSIWLQVYVMTHLPLVDCLPFKKGNNLTEQMEIPSNAIPDSTVVTFKYEKKGIAIEFTSNNFPDDFNDSDYLFIQRYDKLIRKGKNNEPPIKGFSLKNVNKEDITETLLTTENPIAFLFTEQLHKIRPAWFPVISELTELLEKRNIKLVIVTAQNENEIPWKDNFRTLTDNSLSLIVQCDLTAVRSAARINPTLYLLKKGTVLGKWAPVDFDKAQKTILAQPQ